MKINTYLKYREPANEETPIYLNIAYSGFRFKFYTGDKVKPIQWDSKKQVHKTDRVLNIKLENWIREVSTITTEFHNNNKAYPLPETLHNLLKSNLRKVEKKIEQPDTFLSFFEKLIQRSLDGSRQPQKKIIRYSTIQIYKQVKQTLMDFIDKSGYKLDFETLDHNFYDKYTAKLIAEDYRNNTIGKYLAVIKVIAMEAADSGYYIHPFIKSKKYVILRQKNIDNIYLTKGQINELERLDLKLNPTLDRVRDLFLIGCHTGLRYSDIQRLTKDNIQNGYIYFRKSKKTGTALEIPLNEPISRLIKKNKGSFPKKMSNQKVNQYLKVLGQMLPSLNEKFTKETVKGGKEIITNTPKWMILSTHTARRSYCTNAYLDGVPVQDIMSISGHTTEKSFRVYLKMKDSEHSKAANNRRIISDPKLKLVS